MADDVAYNALEWVEYSARIDHMNVERGDADVFTKSGRHTNYKIEALAPWVSPDLVIHSSLTYHVREGHHDWTWLKGTTTVNIPISMHGTHALVDALHEGRATIGQFDKYVQSGVVHGENHEWLSLTPTNCPYIDHIEFRIDGPGNDNHGNAALRVHFKIPFSYST